MSWRQKLTEKTQNAAKMKKVVLYNDSRKLARKDSGIMARFCFMKRILCVAPA
jgi:hypothetical protein